MSRPFVSVLTPTYNRRRFIPTAIACFKAQTYPQDRMEWIILDDGTDKVGDLFAASGLKNVRYVEVSSEAGKLPIGAKRNQINELAKGDICVCWDDDDYYVPDRIRNSVTRLQGQKIAPVAGSTEIYMYFPDLDEIWSAGPYNPNHATNGTMAYWRSYFKTHRYDDTAVKAEEKQFMDDWKTPVAQLRPENVMLVINHGINTFDKRRLIYMKNKVVKKLSIKLKSVVKDKKIRDFYIGLRDTILPYVHQDDSAAAAAEPVAAEPVEAAAVEIPSLEIDESKPTNTGLSLSERAWSLSLESTDSLGPAQVLEHPPLSVPSLPPVPALQPSLESLPVDLPSVPAAAE
jgi:glycosyltransferase involved in cell wall biosynthesis